VIKFYSILYNEYNLLKLQYNSFVENILDDHFRFIVVDNSPNYRIRAAAENICEELGIELISVKQKRDDAPDFSHQKALNFVVSECMAKDKELDISVILDSDIFLLEQVCINTLCEGGYSFVGIPQPFPWAAFAHRIKQRHLYLWPGLLFITHHAPNLETLDLRGAFVDDKDVTKFVIPDEALTWGSEQYLALAETMIPMDSGALFCKYRHENPTLHIKMLDCELLKGNPWAVIKTMPQKLIKKYKDEYGFWLIENVFLHAGRMSNWEGLAQEQYLPKFELLKELLEYKDREREERKGWDWGIEGLP
jgi:hypothetical protein